MSQKYPARVCSLSSFWTAVPPCCVNSLSYTSVRCERQICKISGSLAHWCGNGSLGLGNPGSLPGTRRVRPAGCAGLLSARLPQHRGLCCHGHRGSPQWRSALTMPRREWAPPPIPAGLAVPSARRLLLSGGSCAHRDPPLLCRCRERGKVVEFRKDELKQACSRAFWSSAKRQVLSGGICQKPSRDILGGIGLGEGRRGNTAVWWG